METRPVSRVIPDDLTHPAWMRGLDRVFDGRGLAFFLLFGVISIALLAYLDYLTGPELMSSLVYLIPICLASWYSSRSMGLLYTLAGTGCWLVINVVELQYSAPWAPYWNAFTRFAFFVVATLSISQLRQTMERERWLARVDPLTGALNRRFFYALAQHEIERTRRTGRPFTIAYLDLDNFKHINDNLGHAMGDEILTGFVKVARAQTRATDLIARLGGDEFALLLPETDSHGAERTLDKLKSALEQELSRANQPFTFSMGAMTYQSAPRDVASMIHDADELMYEVKRSGKAAIRYRSMAS